MTWVPRESERGRTAAECPCWEIDGLMWVPVAVVRRSPRLPQTLPIDKYALKVLNAPWKYFEEDYQNGGVVCLL